MLFVGVAADARNDLGIAGLHGAGRFAQGYHAGAAAVRQLLQIGERHAKVLR